jgi:hypothetical protein
MAVVDDAASLFRAADGGATLALLAKLTVEAANQCKMEEARAKLQVGVLSALDCHSFCAALSADAVQGSRAKLMTPNAWETTHHQKRTLFRMAMQDASWEMPGDCQAQAFSHCLCGCDHMSGLAV